MKHRLVERRKNRENGHDTQTGGEEKEREKTSMIHRLVERRKKRENGHDTQTGGEEKVKKLA